MANKNAVAKIANLDAVVSKELITEVQGQLKVMNKGYLSIAPLVAKLYDGEAYKALGYKNFDEMCAMEFEMAHGTTVGIRKVFAKFGSKNTQTGTYSIPEKYLDWGYTKLLLFTDKKWAEANVNPLEEFNPNMTIGEMRATLNNLLVDKAKAQDESAIDTTATDVTEAENVSRETSDESTSDDTVSSEERTDKELLNDIMSIAKSLKERMNYIGGEKSCLLDAIIANAKELKKSAK